MNFIIVSYTLIFKIVLCGHHFKGKNFFEIYQKKQQKQIIFDMALTSLEDKPDNVIV